MCIRDSNSCSPKSSYNKKTDFSGEVYQEAYEIINAAIDSNLKMDPEGLSFCDLEVVYFLLFYLIVLFILYFQKYILLFL